MLLVVIRARAFCEEIVLVFVPVETLIRQCTEQLERGVQIQLLLAALMQLCQFDQSAGGNGRCGGILPCHILRLAEIDRNQPALRNVRDKIVRDPLRRLQIRTVSGVQEAQRKAVQAPGLAARPGGTLLIALAAVIPVSGSNSTICLTEPSPRTKQRCAVSAWWTAI